MNPFEAPTTTRFNVESMLCKLDVGDCKKANYDNCELKVYRATISSVSKKLGFKIKTKTDPKGQLWIKRVL